MSSRHVVLSGTCITLAIVLGLANRPAASTGTGPTTSSTVQNLESEGYERVLRQRRNGTFTKAGWNHYGPGYFELDEQTGVLTSHGGMGPTRAWAVEISSTEYAGRGAGRTNALLEHGSTRHAGFTAPAMCVAKSNHVHWPPSVTW